MPRAVRTPSLSLTALATAALVAGILGGAAHAQPDNLIHACAGPGEGQLRAVADAGDCRTNEQILTWNQQGPAGPQGQQGEPGPAGQQGEQGEPGPAGLSAAYAAELAHHVVIDLAPSGDSLDDWTVVLSEDVPAGTYVVTAVVALRNGDGSESSLMGCILHGGDSPWMFAGRNSGVDTLQSWDLPILGTAGFAEPGTLTLACFGEGGDPKVFSAAFTAIAVDTVQ